MHPGTRPLRSHLRAPSLALLPLALQLGGLLLGTGLLGTTPSARAQAATVGQWTEVQSWPDTGTHVALLPTGKVLSWAEIHPDVFHLWDPATNKVSTAAHPGYNAFCSGFSTMADGKLFVAGGHIDSNQGLPYASIYDPWKNTWTRLPDMNAGRWYPTTTALPTGEMLTIAGTATAVRVGENRLPQVWQPELGAWRNLTDAQRTLRTYPWMFVAPNGKVFMAGPDPVSAYLDTRGTGAWTTVSSSLFGDRFYGSAVMYDEGKVMVSGGGQYEATATVEVIDLDAAKPAFRNVQRMAQPRKQHNMTLLPDGTVLVTGGSSGPGKDDDTSPVFTTELWDPATEHFTVLAPSKVYRGYHSSALLLPDARVLSVGGVDTENAQVFSPPYLFKGPRPTITSAPAAVGYGETFTVATPDAASIAQVTWVRPGAATHAFNQGQRINRLSFTRQAGAVSITAPATSIQAPPGHYLLFLLSDKGVPSVAQWVRVSGPDATAVEVEAVAAGAAWKYDARGVAPGDGWLAADFDDAQWRTGRGGFSTAAGGTGTQLQLEEGLPTAYFRKAFVLHGTALGARLVVQAQDGVAVWVNGTRVLARNVGAGTDPATWATAAAAAGAQVEVDVPAGLLVDGVNQVAVMVKQARPTEARPAPELRFDLELSVSTRGQAEPVPVLSLQAPNGGESLESGTTVPLTWSTDGTLAQVRLEYSADGGGRWEPIEASVPNTGSYTWRVPVLESTQVAVRVSGAGAPASADASDAAFTIHALCTGCVPPGGGCEEAGAVCGGGSVCLGTPRVCRARCTADAACSSGEVCGEADGQRVCLPGPSAQVCGDPGQPACDSNDDDPGHKGVGCSATGLAPSALGLLLALGLGLRRRSRA